MTLAQAKLDAPGDWDDMSVLSFVGPEEGGFRPNVLLTHEPHSGDLATYVERQKKQLKLELAKYKLHKAEDATVAGVPAVVLEHSFQGEPGQVIRQRLVFVAKDGYAYTLSCSHLEKLFETHRERFAAMANGLRLA